MSTQLYKYNALDCGITAEVYENLRERFTPQTQHVYEFERACQGPALAMTIRGIRVNRGALDAAIADIHTVICEHQSWLDGETHKIWGKGVNTASPPQVQGLLYSEAGLNLPQRRNRDGHLTADKNALRTLADKYPKARPIIKGIQHQRDLVEQRKVLSRGVSRDGRFRTSNNVGATETGRWSNSKTAFNEGGNLQNVMPRVRHVFVADPGWVMVNMDKKQAESLCIAYLAGDEAYIAAHETGDVHTVACRIFWPDMAWTGDITEDRAMAERTIPEWDAAQRSFRDHSKRCQHGTNYVMSPSGLARWAHIPLREARAAQARYFAAYPRIQDYHGEVRAALADTGRLTTPFGRVRQFLGRYWDDATHREAVAHTPQSVIADELNLSLYRIWRDHDPDLVQVLANGHDAVLAQVREERLQEGLDAMHAHMDVPLPIRGRIMTISHDCSVGLNWGKRTEANPDGMRDGETLDAS